MISVDGYYPLRAYLRTARSIITERLWGYFLAVNEPPENEDELDEFDWTAPIKVERTEYWRENIEIAARFLVHDVMRRVSTRNAGKGSTKFLLALRLLIEMQVHLRFRPKQ